MSKYIGRQIEIWFAQESIRGTQATEIVWMWVASFDFGDRIETVEDDSGAGTKIATADIDIAKQYGAGKFELKIGANHIGEFLNAVLGKDTVTEEVAGEVWEHLFEIENTNACPTFTIYTKEANGNFYYTLASIESLTLSAVIGEYINVSVSFKSRKGVDAGSLTPTYTPESKFKARHSTFKRANSEAWLSASNPACIESFELTISKETIDDYCLNTGNEPVDFVDGKMEITGSITATYKDKNTYREPALNGTVQALQYVLEDPSVDIGGNAGEHPKLDTKLPTVKYTDYSRDTSSDALVKENLSFKVIQGDTSASPIKARLKNAVELY